LKTNIESARNAIMRALYPNGEQSPGTSEPQEF
jgi:hypothetical protein